MVTRTRTAVVLVAAAAALLAVGLAFDLNSRRADLQYLQAQRARAALGVATLTMVLATAALTRAAEQRRNLLPAAYAWATVTAVQLVLWVVRAGKSPVATMPPGPIAATAGVTAAAGGVLLYLLAPRLREAAGRLSRPRAA